MYLILLLGQTIKNEKTMLIAYWANAVLLIMIFNLMLDQVSVGYPLAISIYILIVYLLVKMVKQHKAKHTLEILKRDINITAYQQKMIQPFVFQMIKEIHRDYIQELQKIRQEREEKNIIFSQFAHNMKTSVAVIQLAIDSKNTEAIIDIEVETQNQKKYLEEMLNILRFDAFVNDYIPEKIEIVKLVQELINDRRRDFIYSGVFPKIEGEPYSVYTDAKWCKYILWQVLSNAIKYSQKGDTITLKTYQGENATILEIKDQGIGIPEEDLERVYDMFYTGKNGRELPGATGIGLAMVKRIAFKLGHEVSIESQVGKGTMFKISFLTSV